MPERWGLAWELFYLAVLVLNVIAIVAQVVALAFGVGAWSMLAVQLGAVWFLWAVRP